MAGRILNRKELREQADAAEKSSDGAAKKPAKAPAKRKSRAAAKGEVRMKAFWGVFNQSLKRVAMFEHSEKKQADKKAAELSASGKSPHFVRPVKEALVVPVA